MFIAHVEYSRWFSRYVHSRGLHLSQSNNRIVVRISSKACSFSNRTEALYCRTWFPCGWYAEYKLNQCILPSWWKFHLQFRLDILVEEEKVIVAPAPDICQPEILIAKPGNFMSIPFLPQALLILGRLTFPLPTFELHAIAPRPNKF